jgi:hypothetical protein
MHFGHNKTYECEADSILSLGKGSIINLFKLYNNKIYKLSDIWLVNWKTAFEEGFVFTCED